MCIDNIIEHLKIHDIKPSYQRIKIFEYLLNKKTHPTVDEIYQEIVKEIPTLSKTTVYNTLSIFIQKGIVMMITIEENETRYDADITTHGHFKCSVCNKVYDIPVNIDSMLSEGAKDFEIKEYHIYLRGCCPNCKK